MIVLKYTVCWVFVDFSVGKTVIAQKKIHIWRLGKQIACPDVDFLRGIGKLKIQRLLNASTQQYPNVITWDGYPQDKRAGKTAY